MKVGDNSIHKVQGRGAIPTWVSREDVKNVQNILNVHGSKENLLLVSKIAVENLIVIFWTSNNVFLKIDIIKSLLEEYGVMICTDLEVFQTNNRVF